MPSNHRPPAPSRRFPAGGRRRAGLFVAIGTAAGLALTPALPGPAAAAPTAHLVTGSTVARSGVTAAAAGSDVRGVLERVVVEPDASPGTDSSGTPTAWLRTSTERIPLEADAVRGIPAGSTIAVRLAPEASPARPGTNRPRAVSSVTVLSRATSTTPTAAGTAVHAVTVVLVLPPGAKANATTTASLAKTVNVGVSRFWSGASDGRVTFTVAKTVGWTKLTSSCKDVWAVWE